MKLVVGLGNPGKSYEKTRHNVGFMVVDNYLGDVVWKKETDGLTFTANVESEKVIFLKPLTYMNESGMAVSRIANYFNIEAKDILIIHDDLDLKIGDFKIKSNSSSGGHNGIKSIINHLSTEEFGRLKIGIGNANIDTRDYVLSKLSKVEIEKLNSDLYKDIINTFIKYDINKAMSLYNCKRG